MRQRNGVGAVTGLSGFSHEPPPRAKTHGRAADRVDEECWKELTAAGHRRVLYAAGLKHLSDKVYDF